MMSFFEELNNLVAENPVGRVLAYTLLIFLVSAFVAVGLVVLFLKFIYRHIS